MGHFGIEKFLQRLLFHTTKLRRQIQQCDKYVSLLYLIMLLKEIIQGFIFQKTSVTKKESNWDNSAQLLSLSLFVKCISTQSPTSNPQ